MGRFLITAFYKFVRLDNYQELQLPLLNQCRHWGVKGSVLLAEEGINGTISGPEGGIQKVLSYLSSDPRLKELIYKSSWNDTMPFRRLKVRLKKEIVTLGVDGIDPNKKVGTYVKPEDWNELIQKDDIILIDTRNSYEVGIGTFEGAMNPNTQFFKEFPQWLKEQPALKDRKTTRVAMFCTGGIRCEKASSYMLEAGYEEIYHLEGGILKYLEEIPEAESLWQGECFVFDERVSVDHNLEQGKYDICYACGIPVDESDKASPHYKEGICCANCHDILTDDQISRFSERQFQKDLDKSRTK